MDKLINDVIDAIQVKLNVEDTEAIAIYERHLQYVYEALVDDCSTDSIANGIIEREGRTS